MVLATTHDHSHDDLHDTYLSNILETMPSAVLVTDNELNITIANAAAGQLFADMNQTLLGSALIEVLPIQEIWSADSGVCFRAVDGLQREVFLDRKDGQRLPLSCSLSVLRSSSGEPVGVICVSTDLSSRKNLERQLLQAQKLESVGQLAAGIAHEINTPIQYVRDNTLFLKDEFENLKTLLDGYRTINPSAPEYASGETVREMHELSKALDLDYLINEIPRALTQTLEGVEAVAKIVRAMRDFSHPGSEEKFKVDLNHSIESTVSVSKNEWKYVADVELNLHSDLPLVSCYVGEINQVLLNLVVNAAHAISEATDEGKIGKGKITISTKAEEDHVEIFISDTGTGIPESIKTRVFDPFFTTKKVGKGSGQGLAIAYSTIVEKHGGELDFTSEVGKGTTFRILLPIEL